MRINKFIHFTVIAAVGFFSSQSYADAGFTKTYGCDTCNYEKAKQIAIEKTPAPNCSGTSNGGEPIFNETLSCQSVSSTFIIVNPVNQEAWKFTVTGTDSGKRLVDAALNQGEQDALERLYAIDLEFRSAFGENGITINASEVHAEEHNRARSACITHPTDFFKSIARENVYLSALTLAINRDIGGRGWNDYLASLSTTKKLVTNIEGVSNSIGAVGEEAYVTIMFGSLNNKLVLNVQPSERGPLVASNLLYSLELGASRIDGKIASDILGSSVHDVYVDPNVVSQCTMDFITGQDIDLDGTGSGIGVTSNYFGQVNGLQACTYSRTGMARMAGVGSGGRPSTHSWIVPCK